MQQTDLAGLEDLVEKLDGVISAKFVSDRDGELAEVHILSDKTKSPKQLSRDIQSAVAAASGKSIEHKIISIAQIGSELTSKTDNRLKISHINTSFGSSSFLASVVLNYDGNEYTGSAGGINTAAGRYKAVSKACVEAVNSFIDNILFDVSEIKKIKIANMDEMNVAVSFVEKDNEKILTGTAIVKEDEYSAIVRATLNAVNRVLPQIQ